MNEVAGAHSEPRHRKVKAFRIGLLRTTAASSQFKPAANVGISPDGGIFVTPFHRAGRWTYGVLRATGSREGEHVTTDLNVKLHYHRSGLVMPSLTGQDGALDRRRLQLPAIPSATATQVLSIVSVRPWELPTQEGPVARGAMFCRVAKWPDYVGWTLSVVAADEATQQGLLHPELREQGLLPLGTSTHGIVSLSGHGHSSVIVVTTTTEPDAERLPVEGGTTVAALRWREGGSLPGDEAFAVWSATLRNPVLHQAKSIQTNLTPAENVHVKQYPLESKAYPYN